MIGWHVSGLLIVLKVTIVLLLVRTALLAMRRASASARHLVIALALFASLAVPLLTLVLPAWEVVPPLRAADSIGTLPSLQAPPAQRHEADDLAEKAGAGTATTQESTRPENIALPTSSSRRGSIPFNLILAWSIVSAALLVLVLGQVLAMTLEVRRARPITNTDWQSLLSEIRRSLGVRPAVALRQRATRAMPLVWGIVRPTILLPQDCDAWPAAQRRAVLTHELGHVARRDVAVSLISHLACAIHWFNPLAWGLKRQLTLERELACDRLVVNHGLQSACYANHLLETARAYHRGSSLFPVMAARSQLEGRIMAILESDHHRRTPSRTLAILFATLFALTIVPLASLTFASPPTTAGQAAAHALVPAAVSISYPSGSDTASFKTELRQLGISRSDVDSLLTGLDAPSALTRAACAWALGRAGDPRAVEPLVAVLRDDDATVREWAARSLGTLEDKRAMQPLIDQLDDPDADAREWIVRTLAIIGDERAAQSLIDRLDDPDANVREWVVRTLATVGDERAVHPLIDRLDDEDASVREWIPRTLATIGDERAVQPLIDRLDDPDANVREWIVRTLATLGDKRAVQPLIYRLDDEDDNVREWAARALGSIGTPATENAWPRRGPEPLMPGLDSKPTPGDPQAIAALIRALDSDAMQVREWAARSLGNMGDESAVVPLIDRLQDPNTGVREAAIRSLGLLRDRQATASLLDGIDDADEQIREWTVRSLGLLQDESAFMPVMARLTDDSAAVREWAVRALGVSGDGRAIEAVSRLRGDESPEVRRWVERALENLRSNAS